MIRVRTVTAPDPLACANVLAALAGPGAPAGVIAARADGLTIEVQYDAARSPAELIEALIDVELTFVPARAAASADLASAATVAARGLDEAALDAGRIIETYLP